MAGADITNNVTRQLKKVLRYLRRIRHPHRMVIFRRFSPYTMIGIDKYLDNLQIAALARSVPGAVVECGVWRGGMSAGIAATLGTGREYVLFDSFEGLPPVEEIDGPAAASWQATHADNCEAEQAEAAAAMRLSGAQRVDFRRGWFEDTVPAYAAGLPPVAVLRLDGDWYDSTLVCLRHLFPLVPVGGIIIIDDYGTWDGCTKAVHRYLADEARPEPIRQTPAGVYWIRKTDVTATSR